MFKWIKEKKQAALNAKYAEEDKKVNYINGRRVGDVRYYDNGLKGFLFKNADGEEVMRVETQNGKVVEEECEEIHVSNWHHGFVMVDYPYLPYEELIDCVGNSIFCHGIVLEDKEIGKNLWLIPARNMNKYLIYNPTLHTITTNEDGVRLEFDGVRGVEWNEKRFIEGVVQSAEDNEGYGCLSKKRVYDIHYIIDPETGFIVEKWEEDKNE